ncbi:MAG: hypothetical protein HFE46_02710 [Clostridia bacterium]|jgi:hypothetical protein|nr:hypothetical protein [Clostridia bacterium]
MGLFKSAEEKRMEEKMLVKKAVGNIKRYIERLEEAKQKYIEEAKQAKQHGIPSQYRLARSGLAMAVRQSRVAEQLLLNLELNRQTKDAGEATRDFVAGMQTLGKEITALNGRIHVARAQKNMRTALSQSGRMQENLEGFMEESEFLFGEAASDTGLERELDGMIDRELRADESDTAAMDAEIDEMLGRNL